MAEVAVAVNGRSYLVTCDDGEEERVAKLAEYIDLRVRDLSSKVGQVGDTTLILMASLLVADELSDAYDALEEMRTGGGGEGPAGEGDVVDAMDRLAARVADLARRLESA